MPNILPMTLITLGISSALWGGMLWAYSGRTARYLPFILYGLPLSTVVNLWVKRPLAEGVGGLADIEPNLGLATPVWFLVFLFMLSPVFEELIKAVPALLPFVRRAIKGPDDAFWVGMALGIGFGIGEIAYLAWGVERSGQYADLPWYAFTGFLGERVLVVFVHGMLTALFVWFAARRRPLAGFLAGMAGHALVNAGAMLYQLGLAPSWAASLSLVVILIFGVLLFERVRPKPAQVGGGHAETVHFTRAQ